MKWIEVKVEVKAEEKAEEKSEESKEKVEENQTNPQSNEIAENKPKKFKFIGGGAGASKEVVQKSNANINKEAEIPKGFDLLSQPSNPSPVENKTAAVSNQFPTMN